VHGRERLASARTGEAWECTDGKGTASAVPSESVLLAALAAEGNRQVLGGAALSALR